MASNNSKSSIRRGTITEPIVCPIYEGKKPFHFPHFQQEKCTVSSDVLGCMGQMLCQACCMLIQNGCCQY